ncbi:MULTISPECIES: zinc permease [Paenibacillus]|uniref:ZIP family metal transporter n=1 Tax=Paenibacillus tianjinensis TaxID=2810347 RepID=A0ABX7LHE8_9BACL|nr:MULTISPECIES: zinc permease [Paenibacillus]MDF9839629.1 ZIP family zinc transporter [Paenibacillus sp. PastF-2]MDF9846210.1 ZIP family zinc transporter [Paenibacillus sp. PastM-2]MDF9852782.1 ZIP family zinc transporter [Paenibacillus sp. PastF-1]MDH6477488.1 ZIP family zinc transporter [Paenibacillus sp. PastH-2]QSF47482.1 ZIP family metal transporter [Paenibacillus tianjinensis]
MQTEPLNKKRNYGTVWLLGILPLLLLAGMIYVFGNWGTGVDEQQAAPIEVLNIERIILTDEGFEVRVLNSGPEPLTIAQVVVDGSFWNASYTPSSTIERLGNATVYVPYPWVEGDPHEIKLITENGLIFVGDVAAAMKTPEADSNRFMQYSLIGIYVGVIPVGLGLMWYPFMRRFSSKGIQGVLAFTVGLLFFLAIDTIQEGLELGVEAPGVFQGTGLVWFGALLSFLFLLAVDQTNIKKNTVERNYGKQVSYKIAGGIGLHNLGEGLAIGAAFAAGEAALGTFLIIGFTLHNITEGIGIAAPLLKARPTIKTFLALAILGGAPAIVGTWIGGFVFNQTLAALFFGIGAGAIVQVIYVITKMIVRDAKAEGAPSVSWLNFGGLTLGILLMYVTALLVNF